MLMQLKMAETDQGFLIASKPLWSNRTGFLPTALLLSFSKMVVGVVPEVVRGLHLQSIFYVLRGHSL